MRILRIRNGLKLKSLTLPQAVWLVFLLVVLFNEFIIYYLLPMTWPAVTPVNRDSSQQLRVMLVADPQLIGYQNEPALVKYIVIWDSDRFLKSGFWTAFNYIQPDVVVFLGDLIDEGLTCTEEDFKATHRRFQHIFALPDSVKAIYIPGDNDVGGEHRAKSPWHVNRFSQFFQNPTGVTKVKFVDFIKTNLDFSEVLSDKKRQEFLTSAESLSARLRVIINHQPVLLRHPNDVKKITESFKPHFFFIGHHHTPSIYNLTDGKRPPMWRSDQRMKSHYSFRLLDMTYRIQIVVPSCSYRMGYPDDAGYAAAIFGYNGVLDYSLLHLPNRYSQLYAYIFFGSFALATQVFVWLKAYCSRYF